MTMETYRRSGIIEEIKTLDGVERVDENVHGFVVTYKDSATKIEKDAVFVLVQSRGYVKTI